LIRLGVDRVHLIVHLIKINESNDSVKTYLEAYQRDTNIGGWEREPLAQREIMNLIRGNGRNAVAWSALVA
jgi:hypothetical protein